MLSEIAIFLCLFSLLVAFNLRKKRLTHVKYGNSLVSLGFLILTLSALIDILFVGRNSAFDIGFSTDMTTQIWIVISYVPGLICVLVGLMRLMPVIGNLNDEVAARKDAELLQREQNQALNAARLRAETAERMMIDAIEAIPDAVIIFDEDDKLVIHNSNYRELFSDIQDKLVPGVEFESLLRVQVERGLVADAIGQEEKWIQKRLERHRNPKGMVEQEFGDGRIFKLSETRTNSGGLVSIRTDISYLREREKTLKESRAKLEEAQSVAHIGNWVYISETKSYEWSDEIFRILGYQPGEVTPNHQNYFDRIHPDDIERIKSSVADAKEQRRGYAIKYRIIRPSGETIYVRELGRLDYDEDGRPTGVIGTMQDVTTQQLVEMELIEAKTRAEEGTRSKSLFLANMSHELRTPLNAVIGFSEVLAKEIFGPLENAKYREYADNIQSSGVHLLSLIDDILDYSRLESGTLELQESEVNLFELAQSTQTMLAGRAIEKSTRFRISKDLDVNIKADERKLKQVLINLVNNAIKFTPEKGSIGLGVQTQAEDYISIFVEDDGYGISEEEIEDVLRPFGRAFHSVTKSIEGTGLGLPLSKSIVELHGGQLHIASNANRAGTTVEIRLPKSRLLERPGQVACGRAADSSNTAKSLASEG